jgi:coatomer subunit beta'
LDGGGSVGEEGVEDAFELLHEINERVRTGLWVGDCFIYNNSSWRLNYCVGGEVCISCLIKSCPFQFHHMSLELTLHVLQVTTLFHLDRPMYLLGYLANQSRVYLIDKQFK